MAPDTSPARLAEIDNAALAAEDLARDGRTDRVCLACGGQLVLERVGTSYRMRCTREDRVIYTSRGI